MELEEKERLEKSIENAQEMIRKGLITDPEAVSQLYRMLFYYRDKIEREYKEV